jgi:hypothetical protein
MALDWRALPSRSRKGSAQFTSPAGAAIAECTRGDLTRLPKLVPSPDTKIDVEHKIRDSYGTKQLIGLMLWSADHLS